MSGVLQFLETPAPDDIPRDERSFLEGLAGPCVFRVPGRDRTRVRVVSTLLHGNEPSGFRAVHRWLREAHEPAVDSLLILASVEAARTAPGFAHRMLPGRDDLNRCFLGPFQSDEGKLAQEILRTILAANPEAVIDIHNNTGHNPPYGVGVTADRHAMELTSLFGASFVWSHLRLGSLMEAITEIPSVTVEVGRSGDPVADDVAHAGLVRFLGEHKVLDTGSKPSVRILEQPLRVCLRPGVDLRIAESPQPGVDLTIQGDLDRHNFEKLPTDTLIGWTHGDRAPLELIDEEGQDQFDTFFRIDEGEIRTRRPMIPIMISTSPAAVVQDCLFYAVSESDLDPC